MKLIKTDHVAINVENMEVCIPFWEDVMGMRFLSDTIMYGSFLDTVQGKNNMKYRIVKFASPEGFVLEILESLNHKELKPDKNTLQKTGLRHFAFEVDDVDAFYKHVKIAGCETVSEPCTSEDGSMRLFFVRDPEYNLIEIMQFFH